MSFVFAPLTPGAYDVAMVDPPWPFEVRSEKGIAKSPAAQYRCMTIDEIAALPVLELLAPGGVIFLWCTWPLIGKQHMIAENAWGLEVKTGGAWLKRTRNGLLRPGTGFIKRSVCEPYLIATRKGHKLRARGMAHNLVESLAEHGLDGLARQHSRKPDEVYLDIEQQTPGWRRADIFSRERRSGWENWGDESSKFIGGPAKNVELNAPASRRRATR